MAKIIMPDVALFEPLCKELEISIPELLSGRKIDAEDQQQTAEQLLMESISMRKLIGLSVLLQLNSVIGVLLVISPFLFHPEYPLNLLLVALGLVECAMNSLETEECEYRPLEQIADNYPKFVMTRGDMIQKRNGIRHVNLPEFIQTQGSFT